MKLPTPIKTDNPIPADFLTFWDGPHSVCGVCTSLNKSTSHLTLCLSLNSFCDDTSRTWASLSPETRCVMSVGRLSVLAGFKSLPRGCPSQAGFWLGSSPCCVGSSPNLRCTVSGVTSVKGKGRKQDWEGGSVRPWDADLTNASPLGSSKAKTAP